MSIDSSIATDIGTTDTGATMLDQLIKGGLVIDGTGSAGRIADVGIRDGRIVAIGDITEDATEVVDDTGHHDCLLYTSPSPRD